MYCCQGVQRENLALKEGRPIPNAWALNPEGNPTRRGATTPGYFMGAIDIGKFLDVETFKARADAMYDELKAGPTAPGFREILIPGELEDRMARKSAAEGIALNAATEQEFRELAENYQVPLELLESC